HSVSARAADFSSRPREFVQPHVNSSDHVSEPAGPGSNLGEQQVTPRGGTRVFIDGFVHQLPDIDPAETREWLDSLDAVVEIGGRSRARYLLARLMERAREQGVGVPAMVTSDYINTIPAEQEPWFPGDERLERRIRA